MNSLGMPLGTFIFWVSFGIVFFVWIMTLGKPPPAGTMRYARGAIAACALLIFGGPAAMAVALVLFKGMPLEKLPTLAPFLGIALVFIGPLAVEFLLVRHSFDETGLRYSTPWTRKRSLLWNQVTSVEFLPAYQWLDLRDSDGRVFHFSILIQGRSAFARTALRCIPSQVLAQHDSGRLALESMRNAEAV